MDQPKTPVLDRVKIPADMKALTVIARVSSPTPAVTMVTPVAKRPITRRKSAGERGSGDSAALTTRPGRG